MKGRRMRKEVVAEAEEEEEENDAQRKKNAMETQRRLDWILACDQICDGHPAPSIGLVEKGSAVPVSVRYAT